MKDSEPTKHTATVSEMLAEAQKDFATRYPETTSKWEEAGKDFVAFFEKNGEAIKSQYDQAGKWIRSEIKQDKEKISDTIQSYLKKEHNGHNVLNVDSQTDGKGRTTKVHIEHKGQHHDIHFNDVGTHLRSEKR
jgi:hypothetical protein